MGSTWYGRSYTPARQVAYGSNISPQGPSDWLHGDDPKAGMSCDPEYLNGLAFDRRGGMMSDCCMWESSRSRKPHGALIFNTFYDI